MQPLNDIIFSLSIPRYLKIEKMDPSQISDDSVKHKQSKFNEMSSEFKQVEDSGRKFISSAQQVSGKGI